MSPTAMRSSQSGARVLPTYKPRVGATIAGLSMSGSDGNSPSSSVCRSARLRQPPSIRRITAPMITTMKNAKTNVATAVPVFMRAGLFPIPAPSPCPAATSR